MIRFAHALGSGLAEKAPPISGNPIARTALAGQVRFRHFLYQNLLVRRPATRLASFGTLLTSSVLLSPALV